MNKPKLAPTLLMSSMRLSNWECPSMEGERELMQRIPYGSTIGSLMYTMVATWSDLAYVIGASRWYMSNPRKKHWEAVKHIFRYLQGTEDLP